MRREMQQLLGTIVRLTALALTWGAAGVLFHFGLIGVTEVFRGTGYDGSHWIALMMASLLVFSVVVSQRILRVPVKSEDRQGASAPRKTAVEPEALRLRDMLALLDEDDLDDLRAEVREGLRDRIRNLTADETESFDDLLTDAKPKRGARYAKG